jgi:hypothetical protein
MAEITSDALATKLAALSTTYTVRFNLDGTWEALDSYSLIVYRGSQKEVWNWLLCQPTS